MNVSNIVSRECKTWRTSEETKLEDEREQSKKKTGETQETLAIDVELRE